MNKILHKKSDQVIERSIYNEDQEIETLHDHIIIDNSFGCFHKFFQKKWIVLN